MSSITHHDTISSPPAPPTAAPVPCRAWSLWQWLWQAAPTAFVVTALAGLAFWGHSTDWTIPKFSSLISNGETEVADWCKEHNVPESECIECNKSLFPPGKDYGWCKEHGVAQCPLHHPDVAQLKTPAVITPAMLDQASRALALKPRAENNSRCTLHQRRIQFASTQAVEKAGIDIAIVQERPIIEAVVANGEVVYDETATAQLASRVEGTVRRVEKQLGNRVQKGDVLALIDAAEVGKLKEQFLQAVAQLRLRQATVERLKPLAADQAVSGRQFQEAEAALHEARIRLVGAQQTLVNLDLPVRATDFEGLPTEEIAERIRFLGLPPAIAASFEAESATSNLFPLRSPLDGIVVIRNVVPGKVVDTSTTIFGIADVRQMWLTLDVRQDDAKFLALGQPVLFRPSDSKDEPEVRGSVSWISTAADERTRTVQVRVDLPNSDGRLRANTFGTGRIVLREEPKAAVILTEALHWDGTCHVVFVRDKNYLQPDAPKFFLVRAVRPGVKDGENTEIIVGLLPGEVIASKNSVALEAQLLKSNLGAGCDCVQ